MSDDDTREPGAHGERSEKPAQPELTEANWEVGRRDAVIEGDGIRVTVELLPRARGASPTKLEFFTRPF